MRAQLNKNKLVNATVQYRLRNLFVNVPSEQSAFADIYHVDFLKKEYLNYEYRIEHSTGRNLCLTQVVASEAQQDYIS